LDSLHVVWADHLLSLFTFQDVSDVIFIVCGMG
jgi:hypothetical protein